MADDFDIVSDLNAPEGTVPAHGTDTQHANAEPAPVRAPADTAKPVAAPKEENTGEKPLSLRDQISSALKGTVETPAAAQQDGGQARGPDGKFIAKPAEVQSPDAKPPAAAVAPVAAPQGVDPQVFASLPAETQASLARTMEGVAASQARFAALEPLEQLIAPRIDAWAMGGMSPAQAMHQLLALSDFAGRDPVGFIQYFAQNNGVNLEEMVLRMEPPAPVDPAIKALQDANAELSRRVEGFTQQQNQAKHNETVNGVVAFATEKDAQGNLLRPHFDELGEAVLPYIGMVKAQNPNWSNTQVLQEAYDRACWGTPSVREKLQQAANAAAEAERLREQTERATKARTASASVPSGAPSSPRAAPDNPERSLRDTIRASMAAHS